MAPDSVQGSALIAVSNALVHLHKEQFGRGPTKARSHFAGPDALVCVMEDVMLPAEQKLAAMGQAERVRESRTAFQAATAEEFIAAIEALLSRNVRAFASSIDVEHNVAFEVFAFESRDGV